MHEGGSFCPSSPAGTGGGSRSAGGVRPSSRGRPRGGEEAGAAGDARGTAPRDREPPARPPEVRGRHLRGTGRRAGARRRGQRRPPARPRLDDETLHVGRGARPPRPRLPLPDARLPRRPGRLRRHAPGPADHRRRRRPGALRPPLRRRSARRLPALGRVAQPAGDPRGAGRPPPRHVVLRRRPGPSRLADRAGAALVPGARLGPLVQRQRRPRPGLGGPAPRSAGAPRLPPGRAVPPVSPVAGLDRDVTDLGRRPSRSGEPHGRGRRDRRAKPDLDRRRHRPRPAALFRVGVHARPEGGGHPGAGASDRADSRRPPARTRSRGGSSSTRTRRPPSP